MIYYNGPSSDKAPSDVGTVSEPAQSWEGVTRRVRLSAGQFTSEISEGADSLPKNSLAGNGKLASEDFVCFVDGSSTFKFGAGLLGLTSTTCRADYWCASIDV